MFIDHSMKLALSIDEVEKLSAGESAEAFDRAIVLVIQEVRERPTRGNLRWMELRPPGMMEPARRRRRQEQKEEWGINELAEAAAAAVAEE